MSEIPQIAIASPMSNDAAEIFAIYYILYL
jgi:hypothetical protein